MANYAVNDHKFGPDTLDNVLAAIETQLETVDTTKTIRLLSVHKLNGDHFVGALVIDA